MVLAIASEQLLKVSEVAEMLGVSVRSVRREVARVRLAKPVKIGGASRWLRTDVEVYMERLKEERGS